MELALVTVAFFVTLMFTRRRLAQVEERAKGLKDQLELLEMQVRVQAENQQKRLAAIGAALTDLAERGVGAGAGTPGADAERFGSMSADAIGPGSSETRGESAGVEPGVGAGAPTGPAFAPADEGIGRSRSPDARTAGLEAAARANPAFSASADSRLVAAAADGGTDVNERASEAAASRVESEGRAAGASKAGASGAGAAGVGAGGVGASGAGTPPLAAGGGWMPPRPPGPPGPPAGAQPDPVEAAFAFLRELLFGGNTLVRAGILVLLVGVVLLLRWASEHALLPIEFRLAGAAVLAIGLCVVGYRQRAARPGFSRTLQGGGVAALYLVVFFAFRTYSLLPAPLAFALLAGIALFSGVLAVAQDSISLILIAQLFGFLAPLLASTGKGSHVALFSYYLLLNLVVAGVAWFKAWRSLNLLGFAFTFGIASAWGVLRYEPQHFASTEPFLIAFFLLYVAIPVLFALRHSGLRRGWVDGSLVFGTPLATLALQWALVHERPFAMAYSALVMAALYVGLAAWIRRRAPEHLVALGEAFLPIGVGFATLAIPYGLDDHNLTGAAWAIEGAGLYWVGIRQRRWLSRAAGFTLQFLAGAALAINPVQPAASLPLLNTWFLAGLLLGVSSLLVAYLAYAARATVAREWQLAQVLIAWGLWFVLSSGFGEIRERVSLDLRPGALIAWLGLVALSLELIAGNRAWQPARYPGLALWIAMIGFLGRHHYDLDVQPFARGGFIGWPIYAVAMGLILRRFIPTAPAAFRYAHPSALWLWALFCVSLADQLVADSAGLDRNYVIAASLATLTAIVLGVLTRSAKPRWPFGTEPMLYVRYGLGGLVALLLLRILQANLTQPGSNTPIGYLPILNALDLSILLAFAASVIWTRNAFIPAEIRRLAVIAVSGLAFLTWNGLLARTVHHYGAVAFDPESLWYSITLQVSFSLSWTLIALGLMIIAHRRRVRPAWWTGAGLLAVVVMKLFVLDLAELSAPAKIGTFIGVGLLLLIVGAVAPVPPTAASSPAPAPGNPETPP